MVAPQPQQQRHNDSSQYHNNYDSMRNDLQTTLGCEISNDWWEDCLGSLSSTTTTHTSSRPRLLNHDLLLTQILHSDLRDVLGSTVRRPFPPAAAAPPPPLQEISNVHLLCQLEDWVDLSLGHENRLLQDNNTSTTTTTTTTISTKSCYKLFLTHGSHSFVGLLVMLNSDANNSHSNHHKTASSSSLLFQAGSKVLIQSSSSKLKIRHGVWQLTLPGNLVVLGGSVAPLVQARTEAVQKAQQLQGVGVDPTIRALIGNTNHHPTDDEQKEDEGEGESSDLPPAAVPVATVPRLPLVERPPPPPPAHAGVTHATSTTTSRALAPQRAAIVPSTGANAHFSPHHHHRGVQQQQPQPQGPTTTAAVARRSSPVPSATSTETTARSLNPYTSAISATSMASTAITQSGNQRSTTMGNQHNNPYYASSATTATTTHNSSPVSTAPSRTVPTIHNNTAPVPFSLPQQQQQQEHRPPQQHSAPPTTFTNPYASTNSASSITATFTTSAPTASTTTTVASPQRTIAFADLYQLLLLHLSEPLSTSSHMSWLVEMKQWGANIHFNIGKHNSTTTMDQQHASNNNNNNHNDNNTNNKSKKKKKKEYCLEMHALFGVSPRQVVACQLPSRFVEPCFSVSPAELRALTRTDKAASHKITKEGGEQVQEVYFTPMRLWKAQLAVVASSSNNKNNKNHSLTDVANPILTLEPVEG